MSISGENQVSFGKSGMSEQFKGGLGDLYDTELDLHRAAKAAGNQYLTPTSSVDKVAPLPEAQEGSEVPNNN